MDYHCGKFLAVAPVNGLGNRIRALCSYKVLADFLKVPLFIYWHKTKGFDDTPLENLIDIKNLNANLLKQNEWERIRENSKHIDNLVSGVYEHDIATADSSVKCEVSHSDIVSQIVSGVFPRLSVKTSNNFLVSFFQDRPNEEYTRYKYNFWKAYTNVVQSLVPSKDIIKLVEHTMASFNEHTIGIHVRRGDATSRDNPNCYHYGIHPKYIDTEVSKLLSKDSNLNIFLATDSEEVSVKLKTKYKDKIILYNKDFVESKFNSEKEGQMDAMAEMYLLSKTKKLYSTKWSTYSETARYMGNISSETITLSLGNTKSMRCLPKRDGISIITCCMNRNENLEKSLKSWLAVPDVDEIIIVDWGSKVPVWQLIPKVTNGKKIKLISTPSENKWILSRAFNLAASFVTKSNMLKLDADIILSQDFFKNYKLTGQNFFHGTWRTAKNINEESLNGQLYCKTNDFWAVNGYHEGITTYGWDDDDLYGRLKQINKIENFLGSEHISHLLTPDAKRLESQPEFDGKSANLQLLRDSTQANRVWCIDNPWGKHKSSINWKVELIDTYVYVCTRF